MQYNAIQPVNASTEGATTVIAGVEGKRIYIYGLDLFLVSSTTLELKAGSDSLTNAMTLTAYQKALLMDDPAYWILPEGVDLVLSLGGSVQCSGAIWYRQQ